MRFLIDANLPPALCIWLADRGHKAFAVRDVGLRDAEDDALWRWAVANEAAIVSKDEDFPERRSRAPSGPQIVWVRIGNATTDALLKRLDGVWSAVERDLSAGANIIELR